MKILIVTEVFYPENFHINDAAKELAKRGHQIEVLTRQPSYPQGFVYQGYSNDDYSKDFWEGITIHRFNTIEGYKTSKLKKIANYIHFVRAGKKIISKIINNVDVILVYQTGPLTLALPAVYARRKFKIPTIIWTFDIWPDAVYMYGFPKVFPLTAYLNSILKKVYRNVDKILVSSKRFTDTIKLYCGDTPIEYAPNWLIESDSVESTLKIPQDKNNFVFTGNISKAQNLENVIKGFSAAGLSNSMLHIIGDGSTLEALKKLSLDLHTNNIIFHGRHPYNEMKNILSQSDYLILPLVSKAGIDKTEPFKIQSYLQAKKPIYGIINGAGREIIEENHLGLCANPDSVSAIAEGFKSMLKISEEEKKAIAKHAEDLMLHRFNRKQIIDVVENNLHEISHIKLS